MKPSETIGYFQSRQKEMLDTLLKWVEIESPTTQKSSVDQFGEAVAAALADLGMGIDFDLQPVRGNHLIGRWIGKGPRVLLIGHLDTVWEMGTLARIPARAEGDIARGPGVFDMKAGIVIGLHALRLMRDQGLHHTNITWILNSDEEEGSVTSRELIQREARGCAAALVLEPAGPENGIKTKRRGTGQFTIHAHGRAAHAGVEPEKGVNAIEELSRQILDVQSWNRERTGISANVGLINGGTRTNVIPAEAQCVVDVRCDAPEDMEWLREQFRNLKAKHPEARLEVEGDIDRPPMVRSATLPLYEKAVSIGKAFQYEVREYWTGGGSDGNFTAALGVPTLDGLGAEGAGAHADHEHVIIDSLPRRANLLYHLLRNLSQNSPVSTESV
jgi:glutamate carboxypeptidase